ncbi:MAG: hypothetical protein Unbinned6284contig1004_42 [Prokaryotic dsDNA virus sp.]|nr:MAG: hypothetical protein Unbinned6284contig1004_42 [Prokaryotic dsDNA virus sp.]|tara:strand:- start:6103 stop:6321 length:219 start_codon:yes stop_codon:yes gene_type:complete
MNNLQKHKKFQLITETFNISEEFNYIKDKISIKAYNTLFLNIEKFTQEQIQELATLTKIQKARMINDVVYAK